jgi:hypothetical protein
MNRRLLTDADTDLPVASRALREYAHGLLRLQELEATGQTESTEADQVRDGMDGPWERLTPPERDLANGLSADLYMLSDGERRLPDDGLEAVDSLDERRGRLHDAGRWVAFLELLRRGPTRLPTWFVAFSRAEAYGRLGLASVAARFMAYVDQVQPKDEYKAMVLVFAQEAGDLDFAVPRAVTAAQRQDASAALLVVSAGTLLTHTRALDANRATPIWRQVVSMIDRALSSPQIDRRLQVAGFVFKGLAHEHLGEMEAATEAFAAAGDVDPFDPLARQAKAGFNGAGAQSSSDPVRRRLILADRLREIISV